MINKEILINKINQNIVTAQQQSLIDYSFLYQHCSKLLLDAITILNNSHPTEEELHNQADKILNYAAREVDEINRDYACELAAIAKAKNLKEYSGKLT